ncbi:hypothetical protein NW765_003582 [Fusarium oxysporum]|nr:hypothetical protein NW765_003582 [Fusarium oxysporum]
MKNFWGTVSTKYDPRAGSLVCSAPDRCSNIVAEDIKVQVPSKKPPVYDCQNIDTSTLDITCRDPTSARDTTNG